MSSVPSGDSTIPALFGSDTDSWIVVKIKDANHPTYTAKFARMPVYFDSFQHTPTSPIINVQYVIWSPGDSEASVTIVVG